MGSDCRAGLWLWLPGLTPRGCALCHCRFTAWTTWRSALTTSSTDTSLGRAGPTVSRGGWAGRGHQAFDWVSSPRCSFGLEVNVINQVSSLSHHKGHGKGNPKGSSATFQPELLGPHP